MIYIIKNKVFQLAFVILFFGITPLFVSAAEIPIRFAPHHSEWAYRYGPFNENLPRGLMYDSFNKVILVPEGSSIKSIADLTEGELKQITEYLKRRAAEIDALARKLAAQRAFEKVCAQDVYVRGAADKQALIDAGIIDADGKLTKVGENFKGRILAAEEVRARDAADAGFLDKKGNVTVAGQKEGLVRQGKRYFDTSETAEQVLAGTQRAKDLEALGAGRTVFNLKTPVGVVESCTVACPAPDSAAEKIAQSLQSGRGAIAGETIIQGEYRVAAVVNRNTGAIAWLGEGASAELLNNPENATISLRVNASTGEITSFAPQGGRLEPQAVANLQQGISAANAAQSSVSVAARAESIAEFARTGCTGVLPETMSAGEFNAAVEGRFAEVQALKGAAKEAAIAEIVGKTPTVWRVAGVTFRVIGGALNIWLAYDVGKYSAEKIDAGLKAGTIVDEMSATQNTTLRVQFDRLKALWTRYVAALKAEARPCADTKNLSDELFVSMMQTKQNILHLAGVYGGLRETLRQIIANDQGGASEALYDMLRGSGIQSVTDLFDYFGVAQTDIDYYNAPTTAKSGQDLLNRYLDQFRQFANGDAYLYIWRKNEIVLKKYYEEAMRDKSQCKAVPSTCPIKPSVCEEKGGGGGGGEACGLCGPAGSRVECAPGYSCYTGEFDIVEGCHDPGATAQARDSASGQVRVAPGTPGARGPWPSCGVSTQKPGTISSQTITAAVAAKGKATPIIGTSLTLSCSKTSCTVRDTAQKNKVIGRFAPKAGVSVKLPATAAPKTPTTSQPPTTGASATHDFGDAPAPYPTTLRENGPRSFKAGTIVRMGSGVTEEADALRTDQDAQENDDIVTVSPFVVSVTRVKAIPATIYLSAWGGRNNVWTPLILNKPLTTAQLPLNRPMNTSVFTPPTSAANYDWLRVIVHPARVSETANFRNGGKAMRFEGGEVTDYQVPPAPIPAQGGGVPVPAPAAPAPAGGDKGAVGPSSQSSADSFLGALWRVFGE